MTLALSLLVMLAAAPQGPRRFAVLVGANQAPAGRPKLRFAQRDAEQLQAVLARVGGVATQDALLLLDPEPEQVMTALRAVSTAILAERRETVLYFYYSGHADESSLYPNGKHLSLGLLREALVGAPATVRVGIIDACRGGTWTRSKGLTAEPPVVLAPMTLAAEGTVLIASSSGLEEAHESDVLKGSFFTHHFIGGLLGAADASGDGDVSATEAFQYAQGQTVRASARASLQPQHPSFEWNLHGRRDLVLTQLDEGSSTLAVDQTSGPLQVVELPSGLVLLEIPEGARKARLAVPAGDYLVRRVDQRSVVTAREVHVAAGKLTTVAESSLELVGRAAIDSKSGAPVVADQNSIPPAGTMRAALSVGVAVDGLQPSLALRPTLTWAPFERLEVSFLHPALTVLLGAVHSREVLLSFGLDSLGFSKDEPVAVTFGGSASYRHWFTPTAALLVAGRVSQLRSEVRVESSLGATVAVTFRLGERVVLNAGASVSTWPGINGGFRGVTVGSSRFLNRVLPLVQVQLTDRWALDFDSQLTVGLGAPLQRHLVGASVRW